MELRIATRESRLALWQANYAAECLKHLYPHWQIRLVRRKTRGDQVQNRPLNQVGGKALFMKELEEAMRENEADIAVHSLKDIPHTLPDGMTLSAFLPRETAADAFVSCHYRCLDDLPKGAAVGTSSLRRAAQILYYRPDLHISTLRGNVNTRIGKLDAGQYDAIILAAAGLIRLELGHRITEYLDHQMVLPAVGQGIVAIESRAEAGELNQQLQAASCPHSLRAARAERAFNTMVEGSCHMPVAAHASLAHNAITLRGMIAASDGSQLFSHQASATEPQALGCEVARAVLDKGGRELIDQLNNPG